MAITFELDINNSTLEKSVEFALVGGGIGYICGILIKANIVPGINPISSAVFGGITLLISGNVKSLNNDFIALLAPFIGYYVTNAAGYAITAKVAALTCVGEFLVIAAFAQTAAVVGVVGLVLLALK